jgi:hypothetical protein
MNGIMTTEERLEKMECELTAAKRRNRWLVAGMALAVGAFALAWTFTRTANTAQAQGAAGEAAAKEVRATQFVLVDENGKTRAEMGTVKVGGSGLILYDENGTVRATLGADKDGSRLTLFDENGKTRAVLGADKDAPRLIMFDETGTYRAVLIAFKDAPRLALFGERGYDDPRVTLIALKDGSYLALSDEKGKTRAVLSGSPNLTLFDPDGKALFKAP